MPTLSETKRCPRCKETFPRSDFPTVTRGGVKVAYTYCKPCNRAASRAHYAAKSPEQRVEQMARQALWVPTPEQKASAAATRNARKRAYMASETDAKRASRRAAEAEQKLFSAYGITRATQDAMWAAQGGRCAICRTELVRRRYGYATDHCHTSGKVRSLTCTPCNTGLGGFRDNPAFLRAAIEYLHIHHPERAGAEQEPHAKTE